MLEERGNRIELAAAGIRLHAGEKGIMDDLDGTEHDALAATGRALAGLVPLFGGVVGELLTQTIPNQRTERIVSYVRALNRRLATVEERVGELLMEPENADLVEEGAYQAARATTARRIEQIATLVANGLAADEADTIRRKRLARLLGELDEDELVLLGAYGSSYEQSGEAGDPFAAVRRPEPTHMQTKPAESEADRLFEAGREHLLTLGLLRKNYRDPPRGEAPAFDARKGAFAHTVEISYLGRLLLRYVGQPLALDGEED